MGILSRTDLAGARPRRVILVDHNETSQAAPGIERADVVEIVDHHRIGDVQTSGPIAFHNMPVGATATVIWSRARDLGVTLPDDIATVMLAAIMTDTLLFKSPTATDLDRRAAADLGAIAGVEPLDFGMELLRARSAGTPFDAHKAVRADLKRFEAGDVVIGIGQYETIDAPSVLARIGELETALDQVADDERFDVAVLLVTDVLADGSHVLATGQVELAERALGLDLSSGPAWAPGLVSRKKQVAAPLIAAAAAGR